MAAGRQQMRRETGDRPGGAGAVGDTGLPAQAKAGQPAEQVIE